jgi:hypothetical protein
MSENMSILKNAAISSCGNYRWWLTREWSPGGFMPFVMLNPSTADANFDDPTIRRCMGFAQRAGAGGIFVVNLYSFRATNPREMLSNADPYGPEHLIHLRSACVISNRTGRPMVCAWGANGGHQGADQDFLIMAAEENAALVCLGKTKEGHPKHPLYIRGDQPFEAFP